MLGLMKQQANQRPLPGNPNMPSQQQQQPMNAFSK
jgi:hypothetical protein